MKAERYYLPTSIFGYNRVKLKDKFVHPCDHQLRVNKSQKVNKTVLCSMHYLHYALLKVTLHTILYIYYIRQKQKQSRHC